MNIINRYLIIIFIIIIEFGIINYNILKNIKRKLYIYITIINFI